MKRYWYSVPTQKPTLFTVAVSHDISPLTSSNSLIPHHQSGKGKNTYANIQYISLIRTEITDIKPIRKKCIWDVLFEFLVYSMSHLYELHCSWPPGGNQDVVDSCSHVVHSLCRVNVSVRANWSCCCMWEKLSSWVRPYWHRNRWVKRLLSSAADQLMWSCRHTSVSLFLLQRSSAVFRLSW